MHSLVRVQTGNENNNTQLTIYVILAPPNDPRLTVFHGAIRTEAAFDAGRVCAVVLRVLADVTARAATRHPAYTVLTRGFTHISLRKVNSSLIILPF